MPWVKISLKFGGGGSERDTLYEWWKELTKETKEFFMEERAGEWENEWGYGPKVKFEVVDEVPGDWKICELEKYKNRISYSKQMIERLEEVTSGPGMWPRSKANPEGYDHKRCNCEMASCITCKGRTDATP